MRVAIIGSGGREHALTWKLRHDNQISDIFCLPGNAGTSQIAQNVDIKATDIESIVEFCKKNNPKVIIIGPEDPLAAGLADILRENSFNVFGPSSEGAKLEGSKNFAKQLMYKYGIPTGKAKSFTDTQKALGFIKNENYPLVIKADGLAAGKGVYICNNENDAEQAINDCLVSNRFGNSGSQILIEEFLQGQEVSLLCFTDGDSFIPMVPCQDHKAIFEGDKGPNTGGMGCYSPVPIFTQDLMDYSIDKIVRPTIEALKTEEIDFRGVLYVGLILTEEGPKVLEYNVRFGDPETQIILPRMESNLTDILMATAVRELKGVDISWTDKTCITVVLASNGYPGDYETGFEITGISEAEENKSVVFHAGTALEDGKVVTAGGRVLNVTSLGCSFNKAREKSYEAIEKINFKGKYFRRDIGLRAITAAKNKEEAHCQK